MILKKPFTCSACNASSNDPDRKTDVDLVHTLWFNNPEDVDPESLFLEILKHGTNSSRYYKIEIDSVITTFELGYVMDMLNECKINGFIGYIDKIRD